MTKDDENHNIVMPPVSFVPEVDVEVTPIDLDGHNVSSLPNPFTKNNNSDVLDGGKSSTDKKTWDTILSDYIATTAGFLERCVSFNLTEKDLLVICDCLEECGEDGLPLDVFAAKLRLLEEDFAEIVKRYPVLEKSVKLSRVRRKSQLLQTMSAGAHRNVAMAKELLHSEILNKDVLLRQEEAERAKRVEDRVLELLLRNGFTPKEYIQCVYVFGDRAETDTPVDMEGAGNLLGLNVCNDGLLNELKEEEKKNG